MKTHKNSFSRFALALGGLLAGLPATAALADEPTTPAEAQQKAQEYREQAQSLRTMGGVAYTTGHVQRAETQAARYEALAENLASPTPAPSPEAEHYADLAKSYRAQGGFTYKTGQVQWAEAEQRKYEAAAAAAGGPPAPAPEEEKPACEKPSVGLPNCTP